MAYTSTHWGAYRPRVESGRLVAMDPAPWDPDPSRIGASMPEAVTGPARVLRPAIREGWLKGGGRRGTDRYVEVSWDDALDRVATALRDVRDRHGHAAIYGGSYGWASAGRFHHAQSHVHRFLNGFGGYVGSTDTYSLGAGRVLMPHVVADMDTLLQSHTAWHRLAGHCELFVAFGGLPLKNAQVSPGGASRHQVRQALRELRERGTQFVNISPVRADLDAVDDAQWWPIRPGSDAALMLALAQVWIETSRHDEHFLARCTVGFERFRDFVTGRVDGVAKTPAWAAERTGLDAARITGLAHRMASSRTLVNCAYALQRARHGEQPFWLTVVLAAMLGQIGLPGGGFGLGYGCMNNTGSGRAAFSGPRLPQGVNPVRQDIPVARIVDMLLHPGDAYAYNGGTRHYPDIRLVYWAGGNVFHHHQDVNRLVQAWQRPETIVVHEPYWTATARHADIVLPATTPLERDDIGSAAGDGHMIAMKAAIAPIGEARDDYAIFAALAQRLGFGAAYTEGRGVREWLHHLYEASRGRAAAAGVELPRFDDFWRDGVFELPAASRDPVLLADFRADPAAHPLPTPSGRIEIHSETIESFGLADCPGHPAWFEPEPSPWPLHLLSNQPATRLHSQYDAGPVSRASKVHGREPITLHPDDAAARGIAEGEVVRVFNDRGAFLAGARLDAGIARGVALVATGAWYDPLDPAQPGSPCRHGHPNAVTPDVGSSSLSQGCSAQSARVDVERWTGPVPPVAVHGPPAFAPFIPRPRGSDLEIDP